MTREITTRIGIIALIAAGAAVSSGASLFQESSEYTGNRPHYERFSPRMGVENLSILPTARDKVPKETAQTRRKKVADVNRMRKEVSSEGMDKMKEFHERMKNETGVKVTMTSFFRDYNPVLSQMESDMSARVECLKASGPVDCPPGYSKSGSACHPGGVSGVISYGGGFWENPGTVEYNVETQAPSSPGGDDDDGGPSQGGSTTSQTTGNPNENTEHISATTEACPQEYNGTIVMVKYETMENGPVSCCLSEPYGQMDADLCAYCMTNIDFSDVDAGFDVEEYKQRCCVNATFNELFPLCREIATMTAHTKEDDAQCDVTLGGFVVDLDDSLSHAQAEAKANRILSGIQSIINGYSGSTEVSLLSLGKNESRQVKKKDLEKIVGAIRKYFRENGEARGGVEKVKFVFDGSVYSYHPESDAFVLGGDPILFTIKTSPVEFPEEENATLTESEVCGFGIGLSKGVYSSGIVDVNATVGALGRSTFGNDFVIWFAGTEGKDEEKEAMFPGDDVEQILQGCIGGTILKDGSCCFTGNVTEDENGNQYCLECNGKLIVNDSNVVCVECPDGYNWDAEKRICTTEYVNCLAVYNDEKPGYLDPSVLDSKYQGYPQSGGECVKCENLGLTYDVVDDKIVCVPCPDGQYFDSGSKSCVSCPSGQYLDSVSYVYSNGSVTVSANCKDVPQQTSSSPSSSPSGGTTTSSGDSDSQSVTYDIEPAVGSSVLPSVF